MSNEERPKIKVSQLSKEFQEIYKRYTSKNQKNKAEYTTQKEDAATRLEKKHLTILNTFQDAELAAFNFVNTKPGMSSSYFGTKERLKFEYSQTFVEKKMKDYVRKKYKLISNDTKKENIEEKNKSGESKLIHTANTYIPYSYSSHLGRPEEFKSQIYNPDNLYNLQSLNFNVKIRPSIYGEEDSSGSQVNNCISIQNLKNFGYHKKSGSMSNMIFSPAINKTLSYGSKMSQNKLCSSLSAFHNQILDPATTKTSIKFSTTDLRSTNISQYPHIHLPTQEGLTAENGSNQLSEEVSLELPSPKREILKMTSSKMKGLLKNPIEPKDKSKPKKRMIDKPIKLKHYMSKTKSKMIESIASKLGSNRPSLKSLKDEQIENVTCINFIRSMKKVEEIFDKQLKIDMELINKNKKKGEALANTISNAILKI